MNEERARLPSERNPADSTEDNNSYNKECYPDDRDHNDDPGEFRDILFCYDEGEYLREGDNTQAHHYEIQKCHKSPLLLLHLSPQIELLRSDVHRVKHEGTEESSGRCSLRI